jgi:hypothetical protein
MHESRNWNQFPGESDVMTYKGRRENILEFTELKKISSSFSPHLLTPGSVAIEDFTSSSSSATSHLQKSILIL